jgi:hypothetical protein
MARSQKTATLEPVPKRVPIGELLFDPENPRFPPEINEGSEEILIERFIRDERLLELVESIGNQGYFVGEPLLVIQDLLGYVVLEGNRRLAALKLLGGYIEAPPGRISIENAVRNAAVKPKDVPCLIFPDRTAILRYLGFRHITGVKAWSALQKARYIKRLREEYYSHLSYEASLRALAKETGSKGDYIGQVLAALSLYEKAEAENFFKLKIQLDDIDFSILTTALSYANIVEFIGLDGPSDASQINVSKKNLKLLFEWTFVKGESKKSIVRESRNLKKLAAIVTSPSAVKDLSRHGNLDQAFSLSKGPAVALTEALGAVNRRLASLWEIVPQVSGVTSQHVEMAEAISKQARMIRVQLMVALQDAIDEEEDA